MKSFENRIEYSYNTQRYNDNRKPSKIEDIKRKTSDSLYKNFNRHK